MRKIVSAITAVFAVFLVKSHHDLCSYSNLDITRKSWNSGFINFFLTWPTDDKETESEKNQFTFCNRLRATADVCNKERWVGQPLPRWLLPFEEERRATGKEGSRYIRAQSGCSVRMYSHKLGVVCAWGDVAGRLLCIFGRAQKRVQVRLDLGGQQWRARRSRVVKAIKLVGGFSTELH